MGEATSMELSNISDSLSLLSKFKKNDHIPPDYVEKSCPRALPNLIASSPNPHLSIWEAPSGEEKTNPTSRGICQQLSDGRASCMSRDLFNVSAPLFRNEPAPSVQYQQQSSLDSGLAMTELWGGQRNEDSDYITNQSEVNLTRDGSNQCDRSYNSGSDRSGLFDLSSSFHSLRAASDTTSQLLPNRAAGDSMYLLPSAEFGLCNSSNSFIPTGPTWPSSVTSIPPSIPAAPNNGQSRLTENLNNSYPKCDLNKKYSYPTSFHSVQSPPRNDAYRENCKQIRGQQLFNPLPFSGKPFPQDREQFGWSSSEQNAPLSIFVGNIPKNISPESFHRLMSLKGTVVEVACDFWPDRWLTAFVTYSKPSEASKAVEFYNNRRAIKVAPPHRLVCCFAPHPPASLCCSPAPQFRTPEINADTVPLLPFFPKFAPSRSDRPVSLRRVSPAPRFSLLKDGPPGANLFIYGIPSDWTEVTLMRLCQEFGHIVGIRVPGAPSTPCAYCLPNVYTLSHSCSIQDLTSYLHNLCIRSYVCPTSGTQRLNKGFGFVSYDSVESSARALETLSGRFFLGKPLNIQLKLGEQLTGHNLLTNISNNMNANFSTAMMGSSNDEVALANGKRWSPYQAAVVNSSHQVNRFPSDPFLNFCHRNNQLNRSQPNPAPATMQPPDSILSSGSSTATTATTVQGDSVKNPPSYSISGGPSTYHQLEEQNDFHDWTDTLQKSATSGPPRGNQETRPSLVRGTREASSLSSSTALRCDPWVTSPLSCCSLMEGSRLSTNEGTPTTTAASTPEQRGVAGTRPTTPGKTHLSSSTLPDDSELSGPSLSCMRSSVATLSGEKNPSGITTTAVDQCHPEGSLSPPLHQLIDSPCIIASMLGLLSSQPESTGAATSSSSQLLNHALPLRQNDGTKNPISDLFPEQDVGLWMLLERHWNNHNNKTDPSNVSFPSLLNLLSNVDQNNNPSVHIEDNKIENELKLKNVISSSQEELKALFDQWKKSSLPPNLNATITNKESSPFASQPTTTSLPTNTSPSHLIDLWRLPILNSSITNELPSSASGPSELFGPSTRISTKLSLA